MSKTILYVYIHAYIYILTTHQSVAVQCQSYRTTQPGFAQMYEAWRLACLVRVQHDTLAASRLHETISILKTTNQLHMYCIGSIGSAMFSYVQLYLHFSGASLMVFPQTHYV